MNTTINKNQNATGANCGDGSNDKPLKLESVLIISQAAALSKPLLSQSCRATLERHTVQKNAYSDVKAGYNPTSLKTRLYPAQLGGFVLPSDNGAMRSCGRTALGVWAIGNDPADHVGESTPTLTGGFQSQNRGGQHG